MKAGLLPTVFFCLGTGAAFGCLFLLCKVLRILFRLGKWGTAALDLLFGCFCGAAVFLCALAVDKGRLRLLQGGCQALGAWSAVEALDPFVSGAAEGLRLAAERLSGFFRGRFGVLKLHIRKKRRFAGKTQEKRAENGKKTQKKT